MTCRFENFESAAHGVCRLPQTTLTYCSTKTSTFAPFAVEEEACLIKMFINFVYFIKFHVIILSQSAVINATTNTGVTVFMQNGSK